MFTKLLPQELLLRHAKALGMVFQTHTCHICMSEFKSGNTLHSHIRSIHTAKPAAGIVFTHSQLSSITTYEKKIQKFYSSSEVQVLFKVQKFYPSSEVLFKFKFRSFIQVQKLHSNSKVLFQV